MPVACTNGVVLRDSGSRAGQAAAGAARVAVPVSPPPKPTNLFSAGRTSERVSVRMVCHRIGVCSSGLDGRGSGWGTPRTAWERPRTSEDEGKFSGRPNTLARRSPRGPRPGGGGGHQPIYTEPVYTMASFLKFFSNEGSTLQTAHAAGKDWFSPRVWTHFQITRSLKKKLPNDMTRHDESGPYRFKENMKVMDVKF